MTSHMTLAPKLTKEDGAGNQLIPEDGTVRILQDHHVDPADHNNGQINRKRDREKNQDIPDDTPGFMILPLPFSDHPIIL